MKINAAAVILAAGEGKRLKSSYAKAMHKISGVPIVTHVRRAAVAAGASRCIVVVGRDSELVRHTLGGDCEYVEQTERRGTGHACQQAEDSLRDFDGVVMVLMGDAPLITSDTLARMLSEHLRLGALATVLTAKPQEVRGLGRIERDAAGRFSRIIEERDANAEEKRIREINAGFYCFDRNALFGALAMIDDNNAQREYMLTDTLPLIAERGLVHTVELPDYSEAVGVNDRLWLSKAEAVMQQRIKERLMLDGVTIVDPASTYIEADVTVGRDSVIMPFTCLRGDTHIAGHCTIGPGSTLENTSVAAHSVVVHSYLSGADVGESCQVGPFAHLRPETSLGERVKIGNFVEIKKSEIGDGSKVNHLAYVGDGKLGRDVNVGAGTIFVNYDGVNKHETEVGDEAFIGCNSNLVAPLKIGKGAFVAAGSTITKDVPEEALGVARARQENKEGWVRRRRAKPQN